MWFEQFTFYSMTVLFLVWAVLLVIYAVSKEYEKKKKKKREEEQEERRRIQNEEWEQQLSRYPWLRELTEGLSLRERQQQELFRLAETARILASQAKHERVNWK